jgi:HlyD family secretion protein
VEIEEGELARLPEGMTLLPGMPVEAFVRTGDRTPLSFLTKP